MIFLKEMDIFIYKVALCFKTVTDNLIDLVFAPIWTLYNIVSGIITIWKSEIAEENADEEAPAEEVHHITGFGIKK